MIDSQYNRYICYFRQGDREDRIEGKYKEASDTIAGRDVPNTPAVIGVYNRIWWSML